MTHSASAAPVWRKTFGRIGWGMAVFFGAGQLGQLLWMALLQRLAPGFASSALGLFFITDAGLYGVGLPLALLVVRGMPRCTPPAALQNTRAALALGGKTLVMGFAVLYVGNFVTVLLMQLVALLKGSTVVNPLETMALAGSPVLNIVMLCVVPAIAEELVFRAGLQRLCGALGAKVYVVASAACFALFHGNFYQMLYAFLLGLLLAVLYLQTGRIVLCMGIHFCVNLVGSVVSLYLAQSQAGAVLLGLFVLGITAAGLVLLAVTRARGGFWLAPTPNAPAHPVRTALFTWGMGAFVLLTLVIGVLLMLA